MNGFLLDTNVPSELTRPQSDPNLENWLRHADDDRLFLSVISSGEILKGLTLLSPGKKRDDVERWADGTLRPWIDLRIIPIQCRDR